MNYLYKVVLATILALLHIGPAQAISPLITGRMIQAYQQQRALLAQVQADATLSHMVDLIEKDLILIARILAPYATEQSMVRRLHNAHIDLQELLSFASSPR